MTKLPKSVLFACTRNAIRSPMAAGLLRAHLGSSVRVESAGLTRGELDPFAAAVMRELGIVIGGEPQCVDEIDWGAFDCVIALSDDALARVQEFPDAPLPELWRIVDPSICEGSREQRLAAYRQARDDIAERIAARFPGRDA